MKSPPVALVYVHACLCNRAVGCGASWFSSARIRDADADSLRLPPCRVWEQFLTEAERQLPLRHYAVAAIAMMETSMQLQSLHRPWLAALRLNASS